MAIKATIRKQLNGHLYPASEIDFETLRELENGKAYDIEINTSANTGKWGMSKLWFMWMDRTAQWMAENGATMPLMYNKDGKPYGQRPFNKHDAHELFCSQWLGVDANGERYTWAKSAKKGKKQANKGLRYQALLRHESWCMERGVPLFVPEDSEFMKLKKEQG